MAKDVMDVDDGDARGVAPAQTARALALAQKPTAPEGAGRLPWTGVIAREA